MGIVRERVDGGPVPPWVRWQHVCRYEWAVPYCVGREVLDAACGSGYGAAILLSRGTRSVIGLDIDADAVRDANRDHGRFPGARFLVGDVRHLPFPDGSFDVYVSFETIEHVDQATEYVREARRILRRDGVLLLSTPNRRLASPGRGLHDAPYNRFHVREYVIPELLDRLQGWFSAVELYGQSRYGSRYIRLLARMERVVPLAGVRMHQLRKLLTAPLRKKRDHWPRPLVVTGEPEIVIAVCRP